MKSFILSLITCLPIIINAQYTHSPTGWSYMSSMQQCFYMFNPVLINGNTPVSGTSDGTSTGSCPSNNCDVIGSFVKKTILSGPNIGTDTFACTGWSYYMALGGGYHTVLSVGSNATNYYASSGDSIYFKIYEASTGTINDAHTSLTVQKWADFGTFIMDTLYTNSTVVDILENTREIKEQVFFYNKNNYSLTINSPLNGENISTDLSIFNVSGQLVYSKKMTQETMLINTKDWDNGLYFISINSKGNRTTSKIIISK